MRAGGRKRQQWRDAYAERYKLTYAQRKHLTRTQADRLEACKDDAARRLLLGVSR
jgi:hypothetical protein